MTVRLTVTGLQPGINYYAQFRARNDAGGFSDWSELLPFATSNDTMPPAAVTGLTWTVAGTSFVATWNAVTTNKDGSVLYDFHDYQVTVDNGTTTAVYHVAQTRFDFPIEVNRAAFGSPSATVKITVQARDNSGNLSDPVNLSATNPPPADVTGFTANGIYEAAVLSWSQVADTDVAFYRVREGATAGAVTNVIFEGDATGTTWQTLATGTLYFSVVAVDVFGTESVNPATATADIKSAFGTDTTPPDAPTNVTVSSSLDSSDTSGGTAVIDVSWTASTATDVDHYVIQYSLSSTSGWQYLNVPVGTNSVRINNLTPFTQYYVGVSAVDYSANQSPTTNAATYPIKTAVDSVAPAAPSGVYVRAAFQSIVASWNQNPDKDVANGRGFYIAQISTSSTFSTNVTSNRVTATVTSFDSLSPGSVYYFRIQAQDASGNQGPWTVYGGSTPTAITVLRVNGGSDITAATITGDRLVAATITGDKIAANTIDAGSIKANTTFTQALSVGSTFTMASGGTMQSSNYAAGSAGWSLTNSSLEINAGSIAAAALKLQNSQNLLPPQYAGFEFIPSFYAVRATGDAGNAAASISVDGTTIGSIAVTIDSSTFKYESQALKIVSTETANTRYVYLANSSTTYNVIADASKPYILSAWVYPTVATTGFSLRYVDGGGAVYTTSPSLNANAWQRVSIAFTPTTANGRVGFDIPFGLTVYVDGLQLEEQIAGSTTPSQWKPPSTTRIDGGIIRTGSIQSTAASYNQSGQPAWSINTAGNAQFGDALIRGRLVVGDPNNAGGDTTSFIQSANYASGSAGWHIDASGNVEFNSGTFRGTLGASTVSSLSISASQITAGTLNANVILSGDISTASSGARVSITSTGIFVYDASNNMNFGLYGNGSTAYISGDVYANLFRSQGYNTSGYGYIEIGDTGANDPVDEIRMFYGSYVSSMRNASSRPGAVYFSANEGGYGNNWVLGQYGFETVTISQLSSQGATKVDLSSTGFTFKTPYIPSGQCVLTANSDGHPFLRTNSGAGLKILYTNTIIQCRNAGDTVYGSFAASAFTVASTKKIKKDIRPLEVSEVYTKLSKFTSKKFKYIDDEYSKSVGTGAPGADHIGFIAEELLDAGLDTFVSVVDGEVVGVDYSRMVAFLVPVVQDLQDRLAALESKKK